MAEVEIYKLKKTVDPAVKDYGMFEFFGAGGPFPQNYVREWAGELNSGDLATILGRSVIDPPKGYHGGPLEKGAIVVVDGDAYFLDRESGYKFADIDFDTTGIKNAIHVDYGYYVGTDGAEAMPRDLAALCVELNIPIGYISEPDYHGSHKGESSFELHAPQSSYSAAYLHPQFLKGEEAAAFVDLLSELSRAELRAEIKEYLIDSYPVYQQDLEKVREKFAPELLLPEKLRPLSKVIPTDADKSELAYLAALIGSMGDDDRMVFDAVIDARWHCTSVADIINLTGNLERFDIQPVFDPKEYGASHINKAREIYEDFINKLQQSDPTSTECSFFYYFAGVEHNVDLDAYGEYLAELEGGDFTKHGYLTTKSAFQEFYMGTEDIPIEYRVPAPDNATVKNDFIMVGNADLSSLLLEMHALGGDFMRDAKHNLQTLTGGGNDFYVMISDASLIVTPVAPAYHVDTNEHESWMSMDKTPDTRTFVMSVTDRSDGRILGNLCETDLIVIKSSLRLNSIKHNDPASEGQLAVFLDTFRWAAEQNRRAIPAGLFLQQINESYMASSNVPKPDWFRVSPEAAKDLLAQNAAFVFKSCPEPFTRLMPVDATKASLWAGGKCEFVVRHEECEKLERWAKRTAGEIFRQTERGERDKAKNKGEEL